MRTTRHERTTTSTLIEIAETEKEKESRGEISKHPTRNTELSNFSVVVV